MEKIFNKYIFIIVVGIVFSWFVSAAGISYPVKELNNCVDKNSCKIYCEKPENMEACINFAKNNGLMTKEEAELASQYSDVLTSGGPGNCRDESGCKKYCADLNHLDECLIFAKKHGLVKEEEAKEMEMVSNALKSGLKTPGNCANKEQCSFYCENSEHSEECLVFAEKSGMISGDELEQAKKALPFLKKGETPGKCTNKIQCDAYCANDKNFKECLDFAKKSGMIDEEEAKLAEKTGGKGPGNCNSKSSCEAFCNAKENQEVCFEFGKKFGLIPEEKIKEMKDGLAKLRSGLDQMPKEMVDCIKESLGEDIVKKMESAEFLPGPKTGEIIQACVLKFKDKMSEKLKSGLEQGGPEVSACLEKELGISGLEKIKSGEITDPKTGDVIRKCFESLAKKANAQIREGLANMTAEMKKCLLEKIGKEKMIDLESGKTEGFGPEIGEAMRSCVSSAMPKIEIPEPAKQCLEKIYGEGFLEKLSSGKMMPPQDLNGKIQSCLSGAMKSLNIPESAIGCVEKTFGSNWMEKIQKGELTQSELQGKIQSCIMMNIPQQMPSQIPSQMPTSGFAPSGGIIPSLPSAESEQCFKESGGDLQKMQSCMMQKLIPR